MKHPVLKIKKGAVVYDDTEARRASELPRPALPGTGPFFSRRGRRRRRGIPITFFPLLVVAIGLFILFQVVPNAAVRRSVLNGWQATLRATPYQDRLIVGVTFIAGSPVAGNAADAPEATARLSLPGTGEQTFVVGLLDKSPLTLRGELRRIPGAKKVQAEVRVGNAHVTLRIPAP
jgi:hypothetical protein